MKEKFNCTDEELEWARAFIDNVRSCGNPLKVECLNQNPLITPDDLLTAILIVFRKEGRGYDYGNGIVTMPMITTRSNIYYLTRRGTYLNKPVVTLEINLSGEAPYRRQWSFLLHKPDNKTEILKDISDWYDWGTEFLNAHDFTSKIKFPFSIFNIQ